MAPAVSDSVPGSPGGGSALRQVWRIIRPRRGRGLLSLILASLSLICAIGLIATSAWLISRAWQQPPILYLTVAVVSVRAFGLGRGVFRYAERLTAHSAALRGLTELRVKLVERVAVVAPAGLRDVRRGDVLRRLVDDVDTSAEFGLRTALPTATAVVVGLGVVGLVAWLVPVAGVLLLACLLLAGAVAPWLTGRVVARSAPEQIHLKGQLASELNSLLSTSADVIAARATGARVAAIGDIDRQIQRTDRSDAKGLGLAAAVASAAQGLALLGVVLVAVPAVRSGELAGVNLAVVVLIPLVAFELAVALPAAAVWMQRARASSTRIVDLLDRQQPVPDPVNPIKLSAGRAGQPELTTPAESVRTDGAAPAIELAVGGPVMLGLSVRGLSVTWPGSAEPAISDVSFDLRPGSSLALVGRSGSGKSSIAAALVKFAPSTGEVSLGGVDFARLTGDDVRQVIGYCEQDAYIFDNTVAENVRFAKPGSSDEEVLAALTKVQLGDWVASLPQGMHTRVGDGGAQLSGGQRQRIALARIVLADPPIAIFDEPTEHLDAVSAEALARDILTVNADRSVLYITHQSCGLEYVDSILDINKLAMTT